MNRVKVGLGLGTALLVGVLIGYGAAWLMDDSDLPTIHEVGEHDVLIYASDPHCWDLDLEYGAYEGFGVSWPVEDEEPEKGRPRLVALITEDYLEVVDYEALPPGLQSAVLEEVRRKAVPPLKIRYQHDTPDDPH